MCITIRTTHELECSFIWLELCRVIRIFVRVFSIKRTQLRSGPNHENMHSSWRRLTVIEPQELKLMQLLI